MRIKKLSGYDDRYCEHCGKFKGYGDIEDRFLTGTIFGVYISDESKPDYMLCSECLQQLFDCIKNICL